MGWFMSSTRDNRPFRIRAGVYLVPHSKSIFGQVNLCKVLILNTCRCGEMADATDLKSVRASSSVWVRIPSSAPSEKRFYEGKSVKNGSSIGRAGSRTKTHEMTAYLPSIRQVTEPLIASTDCK